MKKAISLLLAAVTALSMTTVSFAAETTTVDKGDIVRSMKLQKAINTGNSDSASRLRRLLVGRLGG